MTTKKLHAYFDKKLAQAHDMLKEHAKSVVEQPQHAMQWADQAFAAAATLAIVSQVKRHLLACTDQPFPTALAAVIEPLQQQLLDAVTVVHGGRANALYQQAVVAELGRMVKLLLDVQTLGVMAIPSV